LSTGCLFEGVPLREFTLSRRTFLRGRAPPWRPVEQQRSRGVVLRTQRVPCHARVACAFSTSLPAHAVTIRDRSPRRCTDFPGGRGATAIVGQFRQARRADASAIPGSQDVRAGIAGAVRGGFRREEPEAQSIAPAISRDTRCIKAARVLDKRLSERAATAPHTAATVARTYSGENTRCSSRLSPHELASTMDCHSKKGHQPRMAR
jgi:hypothetical protein